MTPNVRRRWGLVMAAISVASGLSAFVLFATGDEGFSSEVLVFGWMFNPARRRVQRWVDRRFDRTRYDAHAVAEQFSARLRDEVDLDGLTTDLSTVVGATLRPATMSLVLVGEEAR